jgi:hypothetical protein
MRGLNGMDISNSPITDYPSDSRVGTLRECDPYHTEIVSNSEKSRGRI